MYIDLYPIIRSLYSTEFQIALETPVDIAAGVINLCAHYRDYFRRFGVETTIYLIAGYNCPSINNEYVHNYNRAIANRLVSTAGFMMNDAFKTNIKILQTICPYLPDIHFIFTRYETSVCIAGMINKIPGPNLVISKDSYPLQLPVVCRETVYLRPRKSPEGDTSFVIIDPVGSDNEKDAFWRMYYEDRGTVNYDRRVHPSNMSLLSALSSYQKRSLTSLISVNRVVNMFMEMGNIPNTSVKSFYNFHAKEMTKRNIPIELVQNRFRALDIPFQVQAFYMQAGELEVMNFENRVDPNALRLINSEYFKNNPLDLDRL